MVDIYDLEKRWKYYKAKQYIPYAIIVLSIFIIIQLLLHILSSKEQASTQAQSIQPKPQPAKVVQKQTQPQTQQPSQVVTPTQNNTKTQNKNIIHPSMDFLRKMKDNSVLPQSHKAPTPPKERTYQQKVEQKPKHTVQKAYYKPKPAKPKVQITIKKTSKKEIESIVQRFKKTNNPVLSLFIAKKYYELGDYHKSYNYALITNQIDATIEDSWIVFTKSLVKLGKKDRAITTLQAYIKTSNSNNAKLLLEKIKTGKFK